jgi:hypothetical protein
VEERSQYSQRHLRSGALRPGNVGLICSMEEYAIHSENASIFLSAEPKARAAIDFPTAHPHVSYAIWMLGVCVMIKLAL